ncbi:MAG: ribosome biogenesis GTPase Der [Oscillospiraceae bacterium]|jgi:GTP-binding protein|nr:ribosome biogenesis GTPase Der [Oscillospiraceae bacterium]
MRTVAIVGRPNVGKSLLFNKLTGKRLSIVEDTPGVTRDRLYAPCEWGGRTFMLIDTGGIEPAGTPRAASASGDDGRAASRPLTDAPAEMLPHIRRQAEIAIETADVIILVCDVRTGLTAADTDVAAMLQKAKKPVVAAVNKVDGIGPAPAEVYEFYNLGLGEPYPVSALHGHGTGDLLDACTALLPPEDGPFSSEQSGPDGDHPLRVAIIGKPNAGKSSLLNQILGAERVVVSDFPGTTRDAVDSAFANEYGEFIFTDTAGMRRKSRVDGGIEYYSVLRAAAAAGRSDVCLVLLDALEGVTEQDAKVAGIAHEAGKPSVIVVNKWDAVEKDGHTMAHTVETVRGQLAYMPYAPIICLSAKTGRRVEKLFPLIRDCYEQSRRRITTGQLNGFLAEAVARVQPPSDKGRRLKIYYMTQAGTAPPHFVAFCNDARLFHYSYKRYLENQIRETFALTGTPIRISVREREEGP